MSVGRIVTFWRKFCNIKNSFEVWTHGKRNGKCLYCNRLIGQWQHLGQQHCNPQLWLCQRHSNIHNCLPPPEEPDSFLIILLKEGLALPKPPTLDFFCWMLSATTDWESRISAATSATSLLPGLQSSLFTLDNFQQGDKQTNLLSRCFASAWFEMH